jgi:hypothetical protein
MTAVGAGLRGRIPAVYVDNRLSFFLGNPFQDFEVFKRLNAGGNDTVTEAIAVEAISHLEQAVIPQLNAVPEPVELAETLPPSGNSVIASAPDLVTEIPKSKRSTTRKHPRAKPPASQVEPKSTSPSKSLAFHPRKSILREFEGSPLRDAIAMILRREVGEPLSVDDILYGLYGKNLSKENLKAARPVVIAELSKGKLANYWSSVAGRRGYYMISLEAK